MSKANKKTDLNESLPFISTPGQSTSEFVNEFWQHTITTAENANVNSKNFALPLARIKKVMKSDPNVKMISSEVTILFEKACQIFIQELTARSHLNSISSRRRTLSRPDVVQAISKSDMFDFLIDIVPRDEEEEVNSLEGGVGGSEAVGGKGGKKTGRGKGKKNKKKLEELEEEEEEEDEVEEGESEYEGEEGIQGRNRKRKGKGKGRASKRVKSGQKAFDEEQEDDEEGGGGDSFEDDSIDLINLGAGVRVEPVEPVEPNILSPFTSGEAIDWTANDFKIGN